MHNEFQNRDEEEKKELGKARNETTPELIERAKEFGLTIQTRIACYGNPAFEWQVSISGSECHLYFKTDDELRAFVLGCIVGSHQR